MSTIFHTGWDDQFKAAAALHLPGLDWRWLKAQCYQESLFNPQAVSPVGAQGMMQIMPGTWADLMAKGYVTAVDTPFSAKASIHAGAAYMGELRKKWWWERPTMDQYALALASYNAGLGNLLKAQKNVGGAKLYGEIIKGLSEVTGTKNTAETTTYVQRIFNHYRDLVLGG